MSKSLYRFEEYRFEEYRFEEYRFEEYRWEEQRMYKRSTINNRPTRIGFHFLFLGAFAVFGGAFRGFNLLLVLAAILIGALLIQWRWSRNSISSLTVRRRIPGEVHAGQLFRVRLRTSNRNRFLAIWMVRLQDHIESFNGDEQTTAGVGIASIPAGQSTYADYDCRIARRGRYRFGPITIETTFPFSLFRCRKTLEEHEEIYVLPRLLKLSRNWQRELTSHSDGLSSSARRSGATDGEFFGLREWQQGDSPRWIHWRTACA